jgi:hypothetical protein
MQRTFIILGLISLAIGLAWPWLGSMPVGRLPGDIVVERENFTFYFPITTLIIISVLVSVAIWLFRH